MQNMYQTTYSLHLVLVMRRQHNRLRASLPHQMMQCAMILQRQHLPAWLSAQHRRTRPRRAT